MVDVDLFGSTACLIGAGVSKSGRLRLSLLLMISLLYLKHAFNESDEGVVERSYEALLLGRGHQGPPAGRKQRPNQVDLDCSDLQPDFTSA